MLFIGIIIGAAVSITTMCLMQINRDNELKKERDYWEREAKKWCAKLGEIRIMAEGGMDYVTKDNL
jgi:hypothetical protein